jgi:hypothetical protein
MKRVAVLMLLLGVGGCSRAIALASHKDKLYFYKHDKLYVCDTDQTGNVSCREAQGAP